MREISNAMMAAVKDKISCFSTLVLYKDTRGAPLFHGSGTLVRVGQQDCLLTAAHVWEQAGKYERVALATGGATRGQAIAVERDAFVPLHISPRPGGGWNEWGPDLALVAVPPPYAADLRVAGKTFYNLSMRRADALATAVKPGEGIWFIVGGLGETVVSRGRQPDGADGLHLDLAALASRVRATTTHGGLDYVDVSLSNKLDPDFPGSYGGLSGSGLWCVGETRGTEVHWQDGGPVTLEGVVFLHRDVVGAPEDEIIRCHGRRSVYDHLLTAAGFPIAPVARTGAGPEATKTKLEDA